MKYIVCIRVDDPEDPRLKKCCRCGESIYVEPALRRELPEAETVCRDCLIEEAEDKGSVTFMLVPESFKAEDLDGLQ